jgi:8-oxo-dGTP pyrophosphatase MutT (NUDIX family)
MLLPPFARHVRQRLDERAPRPPPAWGATRASVLVPLFCPPGGEPGVWLLRKQGDLRHHGGQVALPGGKIEPGESPLEAALRESHEEIGLAPGTVTVLGALDPCHTLSTTFLVSPFVGYVPHDFCPSLDEREVAHAFTTPLALFLRPPTFRIRGVPGWPLPMAVYEAGPEIVWGLTAGILRGLARRVLNPPPIFAAPPA